MEEMLKAYIKLYYDRGWHINAARRLKRLGYGVEAGAMDRAARAAIILHDIGKPYAKKRKDNHVSFPLHEAYSALIVIENISSLEDYLGPSGDNSLVADSIVKAIMLHHMAMNRLGKTRLPKRSVDEDMAEELMKFLAHYGLSFRIPLSIGGLEDSWITSPQQLLSMRDYYILQPPKSRYQVTLRILRVLTVTDNIAAFHVRGGSIRVFVSDICY